MNRLADQGAQDHAEDRLERIEDRLNGLIELVESIEFRLLTPLEKERRRFDRAGRLTLSDVLQWVPGNVYRLMSVSYCWPSSEPVIFEFDYRHDRVGDVVQGPASEWREGKLHQSTKGYTEICGIERVGDTEEWTPYVFLADEKECSTRSHDGTVRLLFESAG